jgi:hypothetical protein
MLTIDGPLRRLTRAERDAVTRRLLDMVENGLESRAASRA